jgi:2-polyprenyl-3-methyl-5-hydroxy-6-metoxy-1,4-benzoquinol methylase
VPGSFVWDEITERNAMNTDSAHGLADMVRETREIWDAKAAFWDAEMGEGNVFHQVLIGPAAERLLAVQPDERILDVGCGNGVFARRLAALGAWVVATDFSPRFVELARARTVAHVDRIDYQVADATNEDQLLALGEGRFDAVVCNMVLMDMPVIDPLLRTVARLLAPGGRFVFAVQHPAFNSNAVSLVGEVVATDDGRRETRHSLKVADYLGVSAGKGAGMPGEPAPHWYFHRPLGVLLGACFAAGFVLDGLEEPALPAEDAGHGALTWANLPGIPPILVARVVPR